MRLDPREPATVLAGIALAVAVRVLEVPAPIRPVVLGIFLLVAPGAALVGNPRAWPPLAWWTAVLSASIAISILVSTALLYAGMWSADRVLAVLAVGSVAGCATHLVLRARQPA